ncbi:flavodoxin reductase (ferredoxin-NADPH reductase) family 1 [Rubidibacter lacunae KORDI 51-2]|uniref:Flavodoxin reductase (Ferredoxin-NADPH reductase) family 1 n=1 Tax=Rubidibacter lacunae KORDI 51-2 TaxID=582515 RepID=U5D8S5_9CHRO|nr:2Fe-2S iron-sulfur cluster-binding protein [Rubidibacter lacunae]ERN41003.1 flavodoxin reductase (ferredoxin-NADPH reductase) family 1 [Rubidibacter lacunae KORDI 51-2]
MAPAADGSDTWSGWRDFVVACKVKESAEITSFYLKPKDGGKLPDFKPGQFLTVKLSIPDLSRPTIRTYSLSDYAPTAGAGDERHHQYYRLSIKREGPPKGQDVPPGLASNFMHDRVEEGTVILAKPPSGKFVIDPEATVPLVLLSNGVGITPMLAMAKAATRANRDRPVWFLHGARNGNYHAFHGDALAISDAPSYCVRYRYSRPRLEDEGKYDSEGYVDAEFVKATVGTQDAEFYICGSPSFMQSLQDGLKDWGVPESRVFFESFSKPKKVAADPAAEIDGLAAEVVFAKSGKTATWTPAGGTLLEFAEANGVDAASSCRGGICLTCMCALTSGEVEYLEPPTGEPDEGAVLVCISKPKTDKVVLDL